MDFIELLKAAGIVNAPLLLLLLVLIFWGKKLAELLLSQSLERYKSELAIITNKATRLHERRLDVILELNKRLVTLNMDMREMTAIMKEVIEDMEKEEVERINVASRSYNEFLKFFLDHKIFLPEETAEKLDKIRNTIWDSYWDYTFGRRIGSESKYTYELIKKASEDMRQIVEPAIRQLESDFRKLLDPE